MALKRFNWTLFLVIVLQVCFFSCMKDVNGATKTDSIFYYIYNQQFERAEKSLRLYRKSLPPNLYRLYETDLFWWRTISTPKASDFSALEMFLQQQLKSLDHSSHKPGIETLIYLNYLMRLKAMENQPLKILAYYLRIQKLINNFDHSELSTEEQSIYEIYSAVFNVGKSKLLMNNKLRASSIEQLERYQNSSHIAIQTIAYYFLAKIYSDLEKSPKQAGVYYSLLNARYPNNAIFKKGVQLCQSEH